MQKRIVGHSVKLVLCCLFGVRSELITFVQLQLLGIRTVFFPSALTLSFILRLISIVFYKLFVLNSDAIPVRISSLLSHVASFQITSMLSPFGSVDVKPLWKKGRVIVAVDNFGK